MDEDDDSRGRLAGPFGPPPPAAPRRREPVFNLPAFVWALAGLLLAIHVVGVMLASPSVDRWVLILFSFIPARYGGLAAELPVPAAALWSPLTYSLLHADWAHLAMNLMWLVAFATPVARRLGPVRAGAIALLASLGGALAHWLAYPGELVPMVGASAVVAGFMGAAARFAFVGRPGPGLNVDGPALPLLASFANPRFLAFVLVWLALNYLFGTGVVAIAGEGVAVAWQAHVGGFAAGLVAFSLFDRR